MPGQNSVTTQQQGTSAPWAAAQPLLNSIIGQLSGTNAQETPAQLAAAKKLKAEAANTPSFAAPATAGVTGLLGGGGANQFAPILSGAYNNLSSSLAPLTNPANLDPMKNPYTAGALESVNRDITNQVDSTFAGAGRGGSPGNAYYTAKGLAAGEAPILMNQYNTNAGLLSGAANSQFGAGNTTASGLTGFNQLGNQNILSGINAATSIPGLTTAPAATQLGAANTAANLPFQNLGWLSSLAYPLAGMGSQSTMNGTTTQPINPASFGLGAGLGGLGLLGSFFQTPGNGGQSAASGIASMLPMIFSDARIKEDIAPVGILFDNTPVYSYRYKGDTRPHIGVMAQDVEKVRPDAVVEVGPARVKMVDYKKATERSRAIAGLLEMAA